MIKISKNPNRTEQNKALFDYDEGAYIVTWAGFKEVFSFTGGNTQESKQNRSIAYSKALSWLKAFRPFYDDIMIKEI